ncbi:MAG: P-loop NTPase, partial [candidate division NC10 bacterium]
MSKFFKALEQAEQERALRHEARGPALVAGGGALQTEIVEQHGAQPPREVSPEAPDRVEEHLVSLLAPASREAEQYRALRHLVEQLHRSADLSVVAVTSPGGDDGKTTTAINLAGALAQAPEGRVLLVDIDLRGSSLPTKLGLDGQADRGLVEAILDPGLPLEAVVQHCPPFNLFVLPAGHLPAAPYEVLKSPRVGELLQEAR